MRAGQVVRIADGYVDAEGIDWGNQYGTLIETATQEPDTRVVVFNGPTLGVDMNNESVTFPAHAVLPANEAPALDDAAFDSQTGSVVLPDSFES